MISFKTIAPFLIVEKSKSSRLLSYAGLGIGILLLLCSVQMFLNINELIEEKNMRKDGYDFVSVTKTITNQNMGKDNRFTNEEIEAIRSQPFIAAAAPLISNQFRAKLSAGNIIPFSTDLFLEAIDKEFIDTVPPSFAWKPGQRHVPIIFSGDYLEMYNIFAPAQDLPQLSASSIGAVNIMLECHGIFGIQTYTANVVAVSDRINSVLVPKEFLQYANKTFGNAENAPAARVYLKLEDANNPQLLTFIDQNNLHINKDKMRFGRFRQVLQAIVSGLGVFSILVILLAMMLFSFYLKLMVARSKDNLKLLLTLGYSPSWLGKTVSQRWVPVYTIIILCALALTVIFQMIFRESFAYKEGLSLLPGYPVFILAVLLWIMCVRINSYLLRKLLLQL